MHFSDQTDIDDFHQIYLYEAKQFLKIFLWSEQKEQSIIQDIIAIMVLYMMH